MRPRACVLALLVMLCADAHALDLPASYRYRIHHQMFGDIGEHHMAVRREGDAIVVEHGAELAVEVLGFTAFHRRTRFREVWRDERLIEFDGLIEDNGEPFPISARAADDYLVIEGSVGRIEAPPDTVPSEPSLERAIRREWFFDSKTGALLHATVIPAGREALRSATAWSRRADTRSRATWNNTSGSMPPVFGCSGAYGARAPPSRSCASSTPAAAAALDGGAVAQAQ